ncbi:MAG: SsrA-binding protein SmpB [Pseudomonadota bacterium]
MAKKKPSGKNVVCLNRRARHDYHIEESLEAGLVLFGSEVKSLRSGRASIVESYATEQEGEIFLLNANIPAYTYSHMRNHDPTRPRKLLLKKREVRRLIGAITRKGMTLVPLSIYFNDKGKAKLELGIAKGKRKYEKRETEKARDWQRQKQRLMKDN